jgi:hypothetical protein
MPPVRRRLFTALSILSLAPFLATAGLWVLSYGHGWARELGRRNGQRWEVASRDGYLRLDNAPQRAIENAPLRPFEDEERTQQERFERLRMETETPDVYEEVRAAWARAQVAKHRQVETSIRLLEHGWVFHEVEEHVLPWRLVAAATSVPPLAWLISVGCAMLIPARRRYRGCCASCGYNLTGNTSGVCPECGTSIGRVAT